MQRLVALVTEGSATIQPVMMAWLRDLCAAAPHRIMFLAAGAAPPLIALLRRASLAVRANIMMLFATLAQGRQGAATLVAAGALPAIIECARETTGPAVPLRMGPTPQRAAFQAALVCMQPLLAVQSLDGGEAVTAAFEVVRPALSVYPMPIMRCIAAIGMQPSDRPWAAVVAGEAIIIANVATAQLAADFPDNTIETAATATDVLGLLLRLCAPAKQGAPAADWVVHVAPEAAPCLFALLKAVSTSSYSEDAIVSTLAVLKGFCDAVLATDQALQSRADAVSESAGDSDASDDDLQAVSDLDSQAAAAQNASGGAQASQGQRQLRIPADSDTVGLVLGLLRNGMEQVMAAAATLLHALMSRSAPWQEAVVTHSGGLYLFEVRPMHVVALVDKTVSSAV